MPGNAPFIENSAASRRQFTRVNLQRPFFIDANGQRSQAVSANFSFNGAFLHISEPFPVGSQIELVLDDADAQLVTAAKVVHSGPAGVGVLFLQPSEGFVQLICELVNAHIASGMSLGLDYDWIPGRIALHTHINGRFELLFTTMMGPNGVWVLAEDPTRFDSEINITLSEVRLFDCRARVSWHGAEAMGLEFIDASDEFLNAYRRIMAYQLDGS